MRISKEKAQENRDQIVEAAAALFRRHGFDGIGVADLMKAAGFTHGGFYNHFKSKDELAAAAANAAFKKLDEETGRIKSVDGIIRRYISRQHRDEVATSCPAATLGGEAAHQNDDVKEIFAEGIENWISRLDKALGNDGREVGRERRELAIILLTQAVGAVVLSRAIPDANKLADEILKVNLKESLRSSQRRAGKER
ncbi:TetR/AcrR family transcriptional regulator [Bradyrhizobium genosp. A]|uniref:TetR/AcrR family transcriptional regulator n=1 Tax=Bradyrhizobium genosp. A TaxID=83626 RepID=UPI003CEE2A5C